MRIRFFDWVASHADECDCCIATRELPMPPAVGTILQFDPYDKDELTHGWVVCAVTLLLDEENTPLAEVDCTYEKIYSEASPFSVPLRKKFLRWVP